MPPLTFAQTALIRHQLQSACHLLGPGPAARETFRTGMVSLLLQTGRMKDEAAARNYLAGILRSTYLAFGGEAPLQNSSPVCYAQAQGLRPGFEEPVISVEPEPPGPAKNARFPTGLLPGQAGFKELWPVIHNSVRQIVSGFEPNSTADPALDTQIDVLVCVLQGEQPRPLSGLGIQA